MGQYSFDIDKACTHLRANSSASSKHLCATYVKNAMKAGGLPYLTGNGNELGRICKSLGFTQINLLVNQSTREVIGMLKGDIASMEAPKHNFGHTCMYDGTLWISDFRLNKCIPYSSGWHGLTFWRWTDNPIYSGYNPETILPIASDTGFAAGSPPPDATTFSGSNGNIFETASDNAFEIASISKNITAQDASLSSEHHTRIYSTNDATIILDELSMPITGIDTSTDSSTTQT